MVKVSRKERDSVLMAWGATAEAIETIDARLNAAEQNRRGAGAACRSEGLEAATIKAALPKMPKVLLAEMYGISTQTLTSAGIYLNRFAPLAEEAELETPTPKENVVLPYLVATPPQVSGRLPILAIPQQDTFDESIILTTRGPLQPGPDYAQPTQKKEETEQIKEEGPFNRVTCGKKLLFVD
jgi:hypothetical protein